MKTDNTPPKQTPFDKMPREDLIVELQCWRNKYNSFIRDLDKRDVEHLRKLEDKFLEDHKNMVKNVEWLTKETARSILLKAHDLQEKKRKSFLIFSKKRPIPFDVGYHYNKLNDALNEWERDNENK